MQGKAPRVSYEINGNEYDKPYYLADGIYPDWATLVKTVRNPNSEKTRRFAKMQEACRKDVERGFGVLQARWAIVRHPARTWSLKTMHERPDNSRQAAVGPVIVQVFRSWVTRVPPSRVHSALWPLLLLPLVRIPPPRYLVEEQRQLAPTVGPRASGGRNREGSAMGSYDDSIAVGRVLYAGNFPIVPPDEFWIPARSNPVKLSIVPIGGIHIFIGETVDSDGNALVSNADASAAELARREDPI
ncbi:hypothetical protein QYE76_037655 [Lolium multiflorum]|uniref:Uncharacterized protein n=1 Tax=Lolium multiflorum TaxID=4521 RepID=A0AAD8UYQ6_LOLMU|nr:hypothetical protein QYE76_037655 [Lolium multiflorum]